MHDPNDPERSERSERPNAPNAPNAPNDLYPLRRWLNRRLWRLARIGPAAAFEPADRSNCHVVIALDLTGQANTGETFFFEPRLLSFRHAARFAAHELHPAGRAARISATRVQDVNPRILLNREDESFV